MRNRIKVTQEMVDYVENHRSGEMRYDENFHLTLGEEHVITGYSLEGHRFVLECKDGSGYTISDSVTGATVEEYHEEYSEFLRKKELKDKQHADLMKTDWSDVRIKAAIAFGQAMINGLSYRPSDKDVAKNAVFYADELIKELQKDDL